MLNKEQVTNQYSTSTKLEARIALHRNYSTNSIGWTSWMFNQFSFKEGLKVLELGSGTGAFWADNINMIPNMKILISDISEAMIQKCKENLKSAATDFDFEVIDAQNIPYEENTFDIVIANHLIYHLDDVGLGIREIKRVLKPGGKLYATTFGKRNMVELYEIIHGFDKSIKIPALVLAERFGLETGEIALRKQFDQVECRRYEDSLRVTDIDILIDYVNSLDLFVGVGDSSYVSKNEAFTKYIKKLHRNSQVINIKKDSGILIATY